jgi:segregation and condensation protein A
VTDTPSELPSAFRFKDIKEDGDEVASPLKDFTLKLDRVNYEGPLDVLLRLIEERELVITEISVAAVADQFIVFMNAMGQRDPVTMSHFVQVAARLMLLKSRALLPPVAVEASETSEETDEDDLVAQLKAYQLYKRAAKVLAQREAMGLRNWPAVPPPVSRPKSRELPLDNVTLDLLARAMQRVVDRLMPVPASDVVVSKLPFTVHDCINRINEAVSAQPRVAFTEILFGVDTRQEIVIMLLALLELLKRFAVRVTQDEQFGEIFIERETEIVLDEAIPYEFTDA